MGGQRLSPEGSQPKGWLFDKEVVFICNRAGEAKPLGDPLPSTALCLLRYLPALGSSNK